MTRPYFLRPMPVPPARHSRPSTLRKLTSAALNVAAWLIVLAVCGIAFYLTITPALPVLIPMFETPKPARPATERASTLGKHL